MTEDVHDRRVTEAALRASEERYRTLFASIDEGFAVCELVRDEGGRGTDHRFLEANPAFEALTGLPLERVIGRRVREVVPAVDASWVERFWRVVETGEPVRFEAYLAEIGRWFDVYAFPQGGDRFAVVFTDVTGRKQAEAALRQSEARLQAVVRQLPVGVIVAEAPSGRVLLLNERAAAADSAPESPPSSVAEYSRYHGFHLADGRPYAPEEWPLTRAVRHGTTVGGEEFDLELRDGTRRTMHACAVPVRDADGRVVAGVVTFDDVTTRRAAEQERERLLAAERDARAAAEAARQDAERQRALADAANAAKGRVLAAVSHDLRSPLVAISGYADLLTRGILGPVSDAQRGALARITAAQDHLLVLINDILHAAKGEAGGAPLAIADVSLAEVCERVEVLVGPSIAAKRLAYACELAGGSGEPLIARADPDGVLRILVNLVANAVKYTDEGGIVVVDGWASRGHLYVCVRDTGPGIAADQLDAIFRPYVQVSDAGAPREGVGLGLAISRDLARAMRGDVTVESTPGVGSRFTVRLPRAHLPNA